MNIADKNGTWLMNEGQFAIFDGSSNTRFEPFEPIKATLTDFIKSQPTVKRCASPADELSPKEQAKLDAENAELEQARIEAQTKAEVAQAAARGEAPVSGVKA